jgi:AP-3 complex subunit beta
MVCNFRAVPCPVLIKANVDVIVSNAVVVLKRLVQLQLSMGSLPSLSKHSPLSIIAHLARRIDDIKHAQARACVTWLVGQYAADENARDGPGPEGIADWAPDVLRKLAKLFASEVTLVKLQIVTLAGKLLVLSPDDVRIGKLVKYVFAQARYDRDWDVRDRGRMLSSLVVGVVGKGIDEVVKGGGVSKKEERVGVVLRREQVRMVLFEGKVVGQEIDREDGVSSLFFFFLL